MGTTWNRAHVDLAITTIVVAADGWPSGAKACETRT